MLSKKRYPYYENGKFKNEKYDSVNASMSSTIIAYLIGLSTSFINKEKKKIEINSEKIDFKYLNSASLKSPIIIPMGHATVLILYKNKIFIFDPIFESPSIFMKRHIDLIPNKDLLPKIDYVILSHDHPDHCDIKSLEFIQSNNKNVQCYVPLEVGNIIKQSNINSDNILEATWWQEIKIKNPKINIKLTCLPARHWSQHGFFEKNKTLWCSWMISLDEFNIYFAGDTAYGNHFSEIYENFQTIDCALLPIAPYRPKSENIDSHMSPDQAYKSYIDLGKPMFIPIHWGVFDYGREPRYRPLEKLEKIMSQNNDVKDLYGSIIGKPVILLDNINKNKSACLLKKIFQDNIK